MSHLELCCGDPMGTCIWNIVPDTMAINCYHCRKTNISIPYRWYRCDYCKTELGDSFSYPKSWNCPNCGAPVRPQ